MRVFSALILLVVAAGLTTEAQGPAAAPKTQARVSLSVQQVPRQTEMASALHQRVAAAGGKLVELRDAKTANLAADLPSLFSRSDEVLLVHHLISFSGLSAAGDKVLSHFNVQVLQSWKGANKGGDVVTLWVPAGGLVFPDGAQAGRRVRGFAGLRDGGRYVLFLRSGMGSGNGSAASSWWLTGDGVQGAFLLDEEKVVPAYQADTLSKAYSQQDVSAFLAELDALNTQNRAGQ